MADPAANNNTQILKDGHKSFNYYLELITNHLYSTFYFEHTSYEADSQTIYEIVLYFFMGILGVLGNVVTCVVIIANNSMHTVTNAYLLNLAVSDILLLIFGFPTLNRYVRYRYDVICKFRTMMFEGAVYVSVLTISAFSVERYLAICHPFRALALSNMPRASRTIPAIWILGFLCALSTSLQIGLLPKTIFSKHTICSVVSEFASRIIEISTLVFFVLPMILMSCLYTRIWINLKQTQVTSNVNRKVIRMLVTVVSAFFICWAPFHTQRLFSIHLYYSDYSPDLIRMQRKFSRVTGVLYYSSAVINPIIYNIMSNKFRRAFKETLVRGLKMFRSSCCVSTNNGQDVL